jgi:hypothetical protein
MPHVNRHLVVCIGQWRRAIFPLSLLTLQNLSSYALPLGEQIDYAQWFWEPFLLLLMLIGVSLTSSDGGTKYLLHPT